MSGFVQAARGLPLSSRTASLAGEFLRALDCLISLVQGTLAISRRVFSARIARPLGRPSQRLRVSALGLGLVLFAALVPSIASAAALAPAVTSLSTSAGPTAGGNSVVITGTDFTAATAVTFGATAASAFTVNSDTQITATAPAGSVGTFDVRVTTAIGTSAAVPQDQYTYVAKPTVTSISPTAGPAAVGTAVTITGTGFNGTTAVTFGATAAAAYTVNSATQITATAPAGTGTVDVRVTTAGGTSATSASDQYTFVAAPTVASLSLTAGPATGGTTVTITGTNLSGATSVKFGATAAAAYTVNSATSITATAPAGTGTIDVRVTTLGGTSSTSAADQYTYVAAPTVTSISPTSGPPSGGTSVTLAGTGFSGATAVTFGAAAATGYTVNSATQITATAPAGTGTVDVRVTTAGGSSATSASDQYTYVAAPSISGLSPAEGVAHATTRPADVTITGTNFLASGNSVTFGGTTGTIVSEGTTSIVVTPPANATGGLVDVAVTSASTTTSTNAYRYLLPPTVTVTWSPATITTAQTTLFSVTVTNPNAVAIQNVRVASSGATTPFYLTAFGQTCGSGNYNASSAFALTGFSLAAGASCTATSTQSGSAGVYQFVTNAPTSTGTATTAVTLTGLAATSNTITIYGTPTVASISPNSGPLAGGQSVTLTGTNFTDATAVTIGGVAATDVTVISATSITATTPAGASAGAKSVAVTGPAGTGTRTGAYTFNPLPTAPTVTAPANGGVIMTLPTYSGTFVNAASTITVFVDGVSIGTVTPASGNSWSLLQPTALAEGPHTVHTTATTANGTSAPSATISVTVDATVPSAPGVLTPGQSALINARTPTYSGTAEAGSTVTVRIDGAVIGTTATTGGGTWSLVQPTDLVDGAHTLSTTAADPAGNVSPPSALREFTIDATAPGAPAISAPVDGATTTDNTPMISGTTEAGATISVTIDGTLAGTTLATGSGAWSYTSAVLADGAHTVSAVAADSLGNVSGVSATITFTVDATAPGAPVIGSPAEGSVTDDGTPTITGTAEDGATVQLTINGAAPVSVTAAGGSWSYTPGSALPAGQTTLSAIAVDAAGNPSAASTTVRFTYSPVTITTATLASGQVGVVYAGAVQASGGTGPYGFAVTSGVLPGGVVLSGGGTLSGTPTANGSFAFTVTATDANGLSTSQAYSVAVARPADPVVTDVSDVEVTANPAGSGDPTVIDLSGAVQNAIRLEIVTPPAHGVATVNGFEVTYTPAAGYFGQDSFTYRAVGFDDAGTGNAAPAKGGSPSSAVSQPATVSIIIAAPTLALTGGTQPAGQIGVTYSQVLTTSGGTAPYSYAVTDGSLPAGLSLATDGTLSGSPTAGGTFSFTVTATDSSTGTGPFSVSALHALTIDAPALIVTPSALPDATTAQAYSQSFSTTGGVAPYSYAVTAGALPTGLTLSPAGVLSGTATQGGIFSFTVSATDSATGAGPYTAARPVTLTVTASTIAVTPASLAAGTRGTPYAASVAASGGVAPYSYAIASGALPAGLTLSSAGQISGTPTVVGSFAFQVRATDSATGAGPYSGVADVTLTIGAATLTVTPTTLPDGLAGVSWSQQLQASGGQGGYSFAVTSGVLPQGLTLSPAGLLSGKPTTAGTFGFTVTATDGFSNTGNVALSVTIAGRPDPSADPDVRGLNTAQAEAARRMVGTQLGNFGRRLEQLHRGSEGQAGASMNLTLDVSAFTPLAEGRRSSGEPGQGAGLDDRRGDGEDRDQLNRMLWGDRAGVATTGELAGDRLNAGPQAGADGEAYAGPRIWTGGAISLGERDATTQTAKMAISTSGISVGVDMSLSDNLDLGVGVGFGQENTDVGSESSRMEADSRVAVAYGSWRPSADVFIDGILGYGDLGFDTRRRTPVDSSLVFGQRDGSAVFGSLSAGVDRVAGPARWISYGRVDMLNADLDAYVETGSPLWALSYEARSVESLQAALGLRYEREILRGQDRWTPGIRVEWTHEFGDAGAQALRYADWLDGPGYAIGQQGWERSRFNLGLSLGWRAGDGWIWTGEYDGAFSNGELMNGLRIKGARAF